MTQYLIKIDTCCLFKSRREKTIEEQELKIPSGEQVEHAMHRVAFEDETHLSGTVVKILGYSAYVKTHRGS